MLPDIDTGVIITLTEWEQKVCEMQHNVQQKLKTKVSFDDIAADLAYCKHNNVYPYQHLDLKKVLWKNNRGEYAERLDTLAFYFDETQRRGDSIILQPQPVSLSKIEQELCLLIAPMRMKASRSTRSTRTDAHAELHNLGGELAFCKLFNLYPSEQFTIMTRSADGDYGDAVMHNGMVVDVEAVEAGNGAICIETARRGTGIDCYSLMTGSFPNYTFRGFVHRVDALQSGKISKLKSGKEGYVTVQKELRTFMEVASY